MYDDDIYDDDEGRLDWDELEGTDERWEDYEYYDDDDDYDDLYDEDWE